MKTGIVIYENCSLWSASGLMELFHRANTAYTYFHGERQDNPKFEVEFISAKKTDIKTSLPYSLKIKRSIYDNNDCDTIIIPGCERSPHRVLKNNEALINWIKEQYMKGIKIASVCSGSIFLAQAGLLDGKKATTHWLLKDFYKTFFPKLILDLSKVIIDHGQILMSGSATSFQNLALKLIEREMGRTVAIEISKIYLIDMNKDSANTYMNILSQKKHNDPQIHEAQHYMEKNYNLKLSLDEIADKVLMTKRTFIRKFKNATSDTPLTYIHKIKVEKAKEFLEDGEKTFGEIAFMLAYEDVNAFRKIFLKHAGISPMKYKARFVNSEQ